jgi:hypothetical protein
MHAFLKPGKMIAAFLVIISAVSLSGCFQFPEGPFFTMQTKDERLQGNWYIDKVLDPGGNDVTAQYINYTLFVQVSRDAHNLSFFKDAVLDSYGTYEFADHGNDIIIVYSLVNGVDISKEIRQVYYSVRKLTDQSFKYIDDNLYEFDWKKK